MSQSMKKRFPSITSIDVGSDGNTSFLRAARNGQLDKVLEHLKSNIDINTSNANGLNALHLASKDGHVEIVKELLKRGAVVDAATKKGNTALHIASLAGQEEVVKLLVQNGASVNVQSQNGFTPLYMAAQENHDNVVRYLLANGANQSLSTEDGFTPLAVAMQQGHDKVVTVLLENDTRGKVRLPALHIAAKKDDVKAAKLLLENEHNPDVTSKSGFTPLHIASHYGNQQIANLLIQKGADVNYSAKHNITPLHVAAKWGKTNMVALLLENGATIEAKTRDGLTPLHCAARSGHEQVVDMLLEKGAPISSKTKNGLAPLHMAAQGDHVDAARILLYHRAPVDEVTVDYLTALHVAAHCGHVRVAKLLLERQADANARALNGFTPLHIACKKNRIKVVELLLKHGASIGATTESGLTPLHVASFMGCMNIVIYLLQHDANPDAPTIRGETPLHLAARANQTDIIRILLRNGAQVDARAREQQTPLHIASRLGNVDIVMLLLQHGAKVDHTTKDMYTALHIAAKEGQDEVAGVLIDNGASINATTKKGFTPLHLASKYGHLKVAKLLLQKEAPVDAQGKNGVTPLHVAAHYDHQNVALLLLDKGASPHATAKNGHTPLHIASRKNQMDIANTLLEYGAQPNAESKAGFTPLHLSAQEGHADMSALLLEHKADPNHEAKNGLAPLHLCAQEDRVPVAEILVKNGAHVDAATKAGYTPLHIACHYGQTNMVRFLLRNSASVQSSTSLGYTPLHQAAQQGHANIVNILLESKADPDAVTTNGQTPLNIAQKLGYISVIETLKVVTTVTNITTTTTTTIEEKYRVQAPEAMQETFMSDSEEEGGEDTVLGDQTYRYLTADEMKSLGDDSLPIDVTRDERIDFNKMVMSVDSNMLPPQHIEDTISPEHISRNYVEYIKKYTPDNVDINRHPINIGFLVSFLVDARGGAMRGCRHSGVRIIVPPRCAPSPTRITCRYVRPQRTPHPPPLMEGEALASRVLELGPVGAKFLGPTIIEVPHFAALRGKEREIVILRSDNGESWKEHTVDATEEVLNEVLHDSFEAEDLNQMEDLSSGRITRIVTQDFPQYFAVVSRVRQEVHAIGPEGGMVSSTVVPQVQAIFPEGALTKKIKVGLQAQPIDPELTAKLLGHGVAVSPVVTVEPRRRKFHKAIRLNMPAPTAHSLGMINQYSGSAPTLRLLCSITGGTTRAQWEDVTGSTPLTFVNDVVSFTTTVSARFWLMDCRNIGDATKMATELYKEAIHVPFMAKFVVFAKRVDPLEARLRVFCMTDDKEDKTLEHQEHFTEVAKSRDVEVLEGKPQYIEFAGNLIPITKSGEQLEFSFRAFRENRLPFSVRVKDQHAEAVGRCLFMREAKVSKGEPPQQPICILNIVLPDDIVTDTISLTDSESGKRHMFLSEFQDYYRPDPRIADMSNLLGEDWVELAHQLGLTPSEINVIKSEYPESIAKQAQSMLRMWLSQSGNKSQTNTLENALRRIGREDIIPQCLNVEHPSQTITRVKEEEIGYRLKRKEDMDDVFKGEESQDKKKFIDHYDKYSAEEKVVEKSESEEDDDFDKTVTERREQIEKRLSAERAIPASSQRREIVQEISSIKRQSIVEDKIAEVKQLVEPEEKTITTTIKPEINTHVSETIEIKTTLPSESKIFETDVPDKQEIVTTKIIEMHKVIEQKTTHKDGEDSKLLKEVTQIFEGHPKIPKSDQQKIGSEDPKSPKFSKTPPPSPADFLIQKQATSIQEWDASQKPAEITDQPTVKTQNAAQQGKPTSTAQYLASNEDMSLVNESVGQNFTALSNLEISMNKLKPIFDQTNAFILSESRAEPYHPQTDKHYLVKSEVTTVDHPKVEKKAKRGFFGTLKTFVSKSSDISDSDSEKTPKKEKKKDRKKKSKSLDEDNNPPQIPIRPPRKPKLPTPTEERKEYDDIPFMEAGDEPPSYAPPIIPIDVERRLHDKLTKLPDVLLQDVEQPQTILIEDVRTETIIRVSDVEKPSKYKKTGLEKEIKEKSPTKEEKPKTPKPKKIKTIILNEHITKTFAPAAVEEEEFTIIIDPSRKESPKKSRETFTLNIDESICQIEQEIMEKSPILSDEKIIKPLVHIDTPLRPTRTKDHYYEDIDAPVVSHPPDNLVSVPEPLKIFNENVKKVTTNLIENEKCFAAWADDQHNLCNKPKEVEREKITDSQKIKRKHKHRLFGVFSKSKSMEESDYDSIREKVVEKQERERSKERSVEPEEQKRGFLGLFSKKHKKEENEEEKPQAIPIPLSEETTRNMIETGTFIKMELDKYEDVRPAIGFVDITEALRHANTIEKPPRRSTSKEREEKHLFSFLKKHKSEEHVKETPKISADVLTKMKNSDKFLIGEIRDYHDVRPVIKTETETSAVHQQTKPTKKPRKDVFVEDKHKKAKLSNEIILNIQNSDAFLKEEVKHFYDVRPIAEKVVVESKIENMAMKELCDNVSILKKQEDKGTKQKQGISNEILINMQSTTQFLTDEVDRYYDIRPTILFKPEVKEDESIKNKSTASSKGILKSHVKTKYSDIDKQAAQNLSQNTIANMRESNDFLKDEINYYYDVRPVIIIASRVTETIPTKEITKKESKGIFGIFKKSSGKKKRGTSVEKDEVQRKNTVLSDHVVIDMQNTETFLKGEVDTYHDVRPSILNPSTKVKVDNEEKKKVSIEQESVKEPKLLLAEKVLVEMQRTDNFLKDEISKYHDVRPLFNKYVFSPKAVNEENEKKESKSILGILRKSPDKTQKNRSIEKEVVKEIKPNVSKELIIDMQNTDKFLKKEVFQYHDVHPIVNEAKQKKSESKDILEIFTKHSNQEREQRSPEEDIKKVELVLSEKVVTEMQNSQNFLKKEVEHYNDVKPKIKEKSHEEKTVKEKQDKKESRGILGMFMKSPDREKREKSVEKGHAKEIKPVLSQQVLIDMKNSDRFLKDEINKYHDARLIIKEKNPEAKVVSEEKQGKKESKGILEMFMKSPEKKKGIEKKLAKEIKPVLSQQVQIDMQISDKFLKDEIDKYYDARLITKERSPEGKVVREEMQEKKESKGIFGMFMKSPEKKKREKSIEKEDSKQVKSVLSEQVVIDMKNTHNFLKEEVAKYHDVCPIYKNTSIDQNVVIEGQEKKEPKGILGIFRISPEKKKRGKSVEKEDIKQIKPVVSKQVITDMQNTNRFLKEEEPDKKESKGILKLFTKSPEKKSRERSVEKGNVKEAKPVFSEQVVIDMQNTDKFLKDEISKYHDVRSIIKETISEQNKITEEKPEKKETKDILGIFMKLTENKKREKSVEKYDIKQATPVLPEEVLVNMQQTDNFLKDEVSNYQDAKPIFKENSPTPKAVNEDEQEKKQSKGIFGMFIKSPEKKSRGQSIEKENTGEVKPVFSEQVVNNMNITDKFLKDEIDKYHDIRPTIKETMLVPKSATEERTEKRESKGILGLLKKLPEKIFDEKEKTQKQPKLRLSEEVIADMLNSDNFLKRELETFHDVRPITTRKTTEHDGSKDFKVEEKIKKEPKSILRVFKRTTEIQNFEDQQDTSKLSEKVKLDMQNSELFLKDEINKYHDVRPKSFNGETKMKEFISPTEIQKEKVTSPEVVKDLIDKKEEKGLLSLFKKKKKHHGESGKLSEETISNMQKSHDFLKQEVFKFHDVRPTINLKDISSEPQKVENIALKIEKPIVKQSVFYADISENIPETTNFLNTELEKYEDSKIKAKKSKPESSVMYVPPKLSEDTVLNMIKTSNFIREEIAKYQDVRPQIKPDEPHEDRKKDYKEKSSKGAKFFGLFGKRKSQERETSVEKDEEKTKKEKKMKKSKGKEDATKTDTSPTKQPQLSLSEIPVNGVNDSNDFLKGEIDRYHDARESPNKLASTEVRQPGGLFEEQSKKTKPQYKAEKDAFTGNSETEQKSSKKPSSFESEVVDTSEIRETIIDEFLQGKKISTVTQESSEKGNKVISVTKEMYIIDPKVVKDIVLDEDIKLKIQQAKADADSLDRDKSKPFTRETFSVETKIIDRIIPISSESETCTEIETIYENVPTTTITDTYTSSENIPKADVPSKHVYENVPTALLKDINAKAVKSPNLEDNIYENVQRPKHHMEFAVKTDSDQFISNEITHYHDVKPIVHKAVTEKQTAQKCILKSPTDESKEHKTNKAKRDRNKSGSPFKIFEKKHKSEDYIPKSGEYDKENYPTKDKQAKMEKRKSGGFFSLFSKSSDDSSESDKRDLQTTYSPDIIKTLHDTTNFLNSEVVNYEDGKPILITDLDDVITGEHEKSGLFSIFSKKRESPKISKKLFKKHKIEKPFEASNITEKTYQKLEDLDEAVDKGIKDLNEEIRKEVIVLKDDIKSMQDDTKELKKVVQKEAKRKKVIFPEFEKEPVYSTDNQNGKTVIVSIKDVKDVSIAQAEEVSDQAKKNIELAALELAHKTKEISDDFGKANSTEIELSKSHKKDKGFLSKLGKLGEKITGKAIQAKDETTTDVENIQEKSAWVVDNIIDEAEQTAEEIKKSSATKTEEFCDLTKDSSFVTDILHSFDSKMEHVKQEGDKIDKEKKAFLQKVDEKYKETMILSQQLADKSKHKLSTDFLDTERKSIETETESMKTEFKGISKKKEIIDQICDHGKESELGVQNISEPMDTSKNQSEKAVKDVKKTGGFFSKLGEKITGREVEKSAITILSPAENELKKTSDTNVVKILTEKKEDITYNASARESELSEVTSEKPKESTNELSKVKEGFKEVLDTSFKDVEYQIDNGTKNVKDQAKDGKRKTTRFFTKLGDKISGKSKDSEFSARQLSENTEDECSKNKIKLTDSKNQASDLLKREKESIDEAISKLDQDIKMTQEEISNDFKQIASKEKQNLNKLSSDYPDEVLKVSKKIKECMEETHISSHETKDKIEKDLEKEVVKQIYEDISKTKQNISDLSTNNHELSEKVDKALIETVKESEEHAETLKSSTQMFNELTLDLTENLKNKAMDKATTIKEKATSVTREMLRHSKDASTTAAEDDINNRAEKEVGNSKDVIKRFSTEITDSVQNTKDRIEKSVTDEKNQVTNENEDIKSAKKKSTGFFGKLSEKLSGKGKDADKAIRGSAEQRQDSLNHAKEQGAETKETVFEIGSPNKTDVIAVVSELCKDIKHEISEESKCINKDVENLTTKATDGVKDIAIKIDDVVQSEKGATLTTGILLKDELKLVKDDGKEKSNKEVEKTTANVADLLDQTKGYLDESINDTKSPVSQIKEGMKDEVKKEKKKSTGFLGKLGDKLSGKTKDAEKTVCDIAEQPQKDLEKAKYGITDAKVKITDSVSQKSTDIKGSSSKIIDEITDNVSQESKEVKCNSAKTAGKLKKDAIEKTSQSLDFAKQSTVNALEICKQDSEMLEDNLKAKTEEEIQSVMHSIFDISDEAGNLLKQYEKSLPDLNNGAKCKHTEDLKENAQEDKEKKGGFLGTLEQKITKDAEKYLEETPVSAQDMLFKTHQEVEVATDPVIKIANKNRENAGDKLHIEKQKHVDTRVQSSNDEEQISKTNKAEDKILKGSKKKINELSGKSVENLPTGQSSLPLEPCDKFLKGDLLSESKVTLGQIKQKTSEFLEAESGDNVFGQIPRTVSDYGGQIKETVSERGSISEANIDLSNLPDDIDRFSHREASAYVTSPVLPRRAVSQKYPKGERPDVVEIKNVFGDNFSELDSYVVTEPEELVPKEKIRKPLFHIESEDDDSLDILKKDYVERSDSVRSNVLETLTENAVDSLLSDLKKDLGEEISKIESKPTFSNSIKEEDTLKAHLKGSQADVDIIEQKLRDLDKALDSLEQTELGKDNIKSEKKLKRVERKFEHMASELLGKDVKDTNDKKLTTPEVEEKRETEFQTLVSQISTEEVSDFQRDYSNLWDENTFSKSDDWESKTPDSQADAQDLPKGKEQIQPSVSQQATSSRAGESHETQEKVEHDKNKKVSDQHQLSEEMKELLKEMEKETKQ